jgi:hypothetical protein
MTRYSSPALKHFPDDMVRFACGVCGRRGQYRRQSLINRFGGDVVLPDLRTLIADCAHAKEFGGRCGVFYVDLKPAPDTVAS